MMLFEKISAAKDYIQGKSSLKPSIALILGSGLGGLVNAIENPISFDYGDIPHFPQTTALSHVGRLVLGELAGKTVIAMQGRLHYYEGHSMQNLTLPLRVMWALGAKTLIVTNAAGGLDPSFKPGDIMLLSDHIDLFGDNPLKGPNDTRLGPRFSDMSDAYNKSLRQIALEAAHENHIPLQQGVYVGTSGPCFETSAERRYMRLIGGNAVGMSTVPEVIVAKHMGMQVLGFSGITNVATGGEDQPPDDAHEVVEVAGVIGQRLAPLLHAIITKLA
ncbi:MAG: purine-nucleoside phosphorylase [Deinococcales bacterium]